MKLYVPVVIWTVVMAGWVQCVFKLVKCDFQEPYKAEIIYAVSVATPLCVITGWIDIEDGKKEDTNK